MNHLVSPAWLAANLADADVVVLDATLPVVGVTPVIDTHAAYLQSHIPGALFFDIEALSDHATNLPHMLPAPDTFAESMSALGVSDKNHIIVYEQHGVFSAPRAWWTLCTFGAGRVSILDGGLRAWIAAGGTTEHGPVTRPAASFAASLNTDAVKDLNTVKEMLQQRGQVVDARSAARFNGTAPEPRPGLRSGHMPGTISLPFGGLVADGRLRSREELREIFQQRGVDLDKPITTTCGSGVTAAVLSLALEQAGAKDVSLYDGSWAEYAAQPDAEIVIGSQA